MQITEIEIGGSYEVGYGQWRKVSIRATISPNEDVDDAAQKIGQKVDEILFPGGSVKQQTQQPEPVSTESTLIEQIKSCTDPVVLSSYKFIAKQSKKLQDAYDETSERIAAKLLG